MVKISKIKLINYRRFKEYTIVPNDRMNIIVGDNEVGKSTILEAINIVSSGSVRRVETLGLEKLLNIDSVNEFMSGEKVFDNLPKIIVELYLEGQFDYSMNGKNNTSKIECDGIRMICEPNIDFQKEIKEAIENDNNYFPYEFYSIRFSTFADEGYSGYKKKIRTILIDNTLIGNEYATNDYVKRMYLQYTSNDVKERVLHKGQYHQMQNEFCFEVFAKLNSRVPAKKKYKFGLKNLTKDDFEKELMIYENNISIDNKGTGKQVLIKTDFALERAGDDVDVVLIEEPENHLSYGNLRKLIENLSKITSGQVFITTHNSYTCMRLELNNALILHNDNKEPLSLKSLDDVTAKYFIKTPPVGILEFILSKKCILVEGPSEYMLFDKFYKKVTNNTPENDGVQILDIRGLSFKRYLEIAVKLSNKVAVVTDNDGNYMHNIEYKYKDFITKPNIRIFAEKDKTKDTFEKVLYGDNSSLCEDNFGSNARDYMLKNKTESAYVLLNSDKDIVVPQYIKEAIEWIKE